jgi:hypothetical protein
VHPALRDGKTHTACIERDNSNVCHYLGRFTRRTKVVSKSEAMVDLSLRIWHAVTTNLFQTLKTETDSRLTAAGSVCRLKADWRFEERTFSRRESVERLRKEGNEVIEQWRIQKKRYIPI